MNWKGFICICVYVLTVISMGNMNSNHKDRLDVLEKTYAQQVKNEELIMGFMGKMIAATETTNTELLALKNDVGLREVIKVVVTAYSPRKIETDETPFETAFMKPVNENMIAVSRNILQERGWTAGDKVWIEGIGIKTIGDLMNRRYNDRVDVFYYSTKQALRFGKKERYVALLKS